QSIQNELRELLKAQEIAREKLQTRNQTSPNLVEVEALRAKLAEQTAMWSNTWDKVAQSLAASEFDTNKPITFTGAMKGIETRLDQRVYVHVESKAANGSAIT